MQITEVVTQNREVYVAPCLECGSSEIKIHDLGHGTFNSGGGSCLSCKHEVLSNCDWSPSVADLAEIWNSANDITAKIRVQREILENAQSEINGLLLKPGSTQKIYLAGPDVFRSDAIDRGEYLKSLCAAQGMIGMYPFDNAIPEGLAGPEAAKLISQANMDMIRNCTGVLINLQHFRGKEPDSGTAFEFGMAVALGKPVYAYFEDKGTLRDQVDHDEAGADLDGYHVEDFGLPRNLMMACTWLGLSATAEEAVEAFAQALTAAAR
jgi:nucleoside 2-deoxyribosyltransferase